jgi:hypothetical protein
MYKMDLKRTTDDQQRFKTNILPGEIPMFLPEQPYRQSPLVNAMYDAEQRMQEFMEAPQHPVVEKSKIYSDQLNRFLTFKNKMDIPVSHSSYEAPVQRTPLVSPTPVSAEKPPQVPPTFVPVDIPSQVPATLKPNFLTPPPTEEKRQKLQCNFFHNWVDSTDSRPHNLAIMTPEQ